MNPDRIATLAASSRVVAVVSSSIDRVAVAWRSSRLLGLIRSLRELDAKDQARLTGYGLGSAVITHATMQRVLGVEGATWSWVVRIVLMGLSVLAVFRPEVVSTAWRERRRSLKI